MRRGSSGGLEGAAVVGCLVVVCSFGGCTFGGGSGPGRNDGVLAGDTGAEPAPDDGGAAEGIPNPDDDASSSSGGQPPAEASTGMADTAGECELPADFGCACETADDCARGGRCIDGVCVPPTCGDRMLDPDELCDDGNRDDDDGCGNDCQPSPGLGQVVAGQEHTCARTHAGELKCWGLGDAGRLGYANESMIGVAEAPADVAFVDVGGPVYDVCAGDDFSCAAFGDGDVRCWGDGQLGKLGNNATDNIGDDEVPAQAEKIEIGGTVLAVACGAEHACALLENEGAIRCWGRRDEGRLGSLVGESVGDNEHPNRFEPVHVGGAATQVVTGAQHTCALLDTGEVRCWGRAQGGRLGNGTTSPDIGDDEHPDIVGNVVALPPVVQLAAGADHTCARVNNGAVKCWGENDAGQLGYGHTEDVGGDAPLDQVPFVALGGTAIAIAAGAEHTCAVLQTGELRCWGRAQYGRLGYGDEVDLAAPPMVTVDLGPGVLALDVAAGGFHTCARVGGGQLYCFGRSNRGQLGYGPPQGDASIGDNENPGEAGPVPFEMP